LVAQFHKILDAMKEDYHGPHPEHFDDMYQIKAGEEDEVVVKITPDHMEDVKEDMEGAFENPPKFTASVSFGRTVSEMHANIGDSCALLPNGVKGHVDAAFAHTMFKAAADGFGMKRGELTPQFLMMGAMSSIVVEHEFRYRAGDPPPAFFGALPSFKQGLEQFAEGLRSGPKRFNQPTAGLADFADGLKAAEMRGLPHKYEVLLTCKNVHVTPLLKDLIGDLNDVDEEAEGEAPAPEDSTKDGAEGEADE